MASNVSKPEGDSNQRAASASGPRTNPSLSASGLREVTISPASATFAASATTVASGAKEGPPAFSNDPYLGATIDGRYLVERKLGEGGMGVVYLCRHTIIDKKVAMKVLRADMARNEEVTERFLNEARSASSIGNPHIIDISDFGRLPDGATYFVMEFLPGVALSELADARAALPPTRVAHIGLQLTEALAAAHAAGIVHRDLKPDNIFLVKQGSNADFVKILDFGIAKATSSTSKLTQAGQVFGTPHYMSPEQASGSEVDHRSDIYALGVILYELTAGQLPFDADNFMAILTQHMYKEPVRPTKLPDCSLDLPPGFEDLILKCMAKSPANRFQSMNDLGAAIREVFAFDPALTRNEMRSIVEADALRRSSVGMKAASPAPEPFSRLYLLIGVTAAALAAALVFFLSNRRTEAQPQTPAALVQPAPESNASPQKEADSPPAASAVKQVAIAIAPLEARLYLGEKDLGPSPVMVEVGDEPLLLEARHEGYVTQQLRVDGSRETVSITLERLKVKRQSQAPATPRPAAVKPKPASSGELVNPWD